MTINTSSSKADLVKYARDEMGLNPEAGLNKESLIKFIEANGHTVPGPQKEVKAPEASPDLEKTFVRINVFDKADDAQKQVIVGVNGVHYAVKRGVDVTVPYAVYEVLRLAVKDYIKQNGNELKTTKVPTEPFTVIKFDVQPGDFPEDSE